MMAKQSNKLILGDKIVADARPPDIRPREVSCYEKQTARTSRVAQAGGVDRAARGTSMRIQHHQKSWQLMAVYLEAVTRMDKKIQKERRIQ